MFIDEYFGNSFYKELPSIGHSQFSCGQFSWTHTYYPHENLELWRPIVDPSEPTKTSASVFQIVAAGQDAFSRGLPLASPKLATNEEFIVVRAKKRPVLLIQPEQPSLNVSNRGFRGKIQRRLCLVAQIFGLADPDTGSPQFSPEFLERLRKMEFPQLMFLPKKAGLLEVDSLLRLDELQSVFTTNLESTKFSLNDEVLEILKGQIQFFFAGIGPNDFTELRELILKS